MIYLDNNATTEPLEPVRVAIGISLATTWHNPSSVHRAGQAARQAVELARKDCAALIGGKPRSIVFTGSGSESIVLAIRGSLMAQGRIGAARTMGAGGAIITSGIEHVAVRKLGEALAREEGVRVLLAGVDRDGVVSVESVRALLNANPDVALVSVQWANNETGAVQPVGEIAAACRERGVVFHCDATQWVGKMPTSVSALGAGLLSFSVHKLHGPKGVGVLWIGPGMSLAPMVHGEQELGRRGGTENVPGIVGAGAAARLALEWLGDAGNRERQAALRDRFEAGVLERVPTARVNGAKDLPGEPLGTRRLWNTTNIGFPRLEAEALLLLLSERGVCASAGAACSSGSLEPSPVLLAMGVPAEIAHGSLRFSLSRQTTAEEIETAIEIVAQCAGKLSASMSDVRG